MTSARPVGVVVDTMVISWLLYERPGPVADRYRALIETKTVLLAFQTVMELRYGALRAGWGELRRRRPVRDKVLRRNVPKPADKTWSGLRFCDLVPYGDPLADTDGRAEGSVSSFQVVILIEYDWTCGYEGPGRHPEVASGSGEPSSW